MKIVAIIQARMGSTRLPGKVLKEVLGKPLLEYQLERVKRSRFIQQIVIATTTKSQDQPITDLCKRLSVAYYRGSEDDVLSRYTEAAKHYSADVIVRLTSDCPLMDPAVIDSTITRYLADEPHFDYVSNTIDRTYPRGLDVEVFSIQALEQAHNEARDTAEREHVTPYIYRHPEKFNLATVKYKDDLSAYRLTVDTEEDLALITRILTEFHEKKQEQFQLEDIIQLLRKKQEWTFLNAHIEQKELTAPLPKQVENEE